MAAAMGGLGKTLLMQSMALDLATGSPVLGRFPATMEERVGLFIMEDPDGETAIHFADVVTPALTSAVGSSSGPGRSRG